MLKNFLHHFIVGLGALGYLLAVPVLLYQYLGLMNDWPHLFLSIVYDTAGDWWLDVNWQAPALWIAIGFIVMAAATHAFIRRNDTIGYREGEVPSAHGF
nr:hypothetical protein [uncultured Pseudodesulfovibrio sp.]